MWELFWPDLNQKWYPYWDPRPTKKLDLLITEVDRDSTGIFWG